MIIVNGKDGTIFDTRNIITISKIFTEIELICGGVSLGIHGKVSFLINEEIEIKKKNMIMTEEEDYENDEKKMKRICNRYKKELNEIRELILEEIN